MRIETLREKALCVEDLKRLAKARLPRGIYEYVARGTDDDLGLRANAAAFDALQFRSRVAVDVSAPEVGCDMFGQPSSLPLAIAPTGFASLMWRDGEIASAKAAAAAGVPFALSTGSITPMEKIREVSNGRLWLQLYVWPQRELTFQLIERAKRAGFEALIVTVDTPVAPYRPYNQRNGFSIPFKVRPRNVLDVLRHPAWLYSVVFRRWLQQGAMVAENYPEALRVPVSKAAVGRFNLPFCADMTWEDIRAIRRAWDGPLIVKGILHPDDAEAAVNAGADGVIVSNHGGRNLDAAMPSLVALPQVAERIGGRARVMLDSGVTRGADIARALALGADSVFIGKAYLFGVGAGGEAGAARVLEILRDELIRVMTFAGAPDAAALRRGLLYPAAAPRPSGARQGNGPCAAAGAAQGADVPVAAQGADVPVAAQGSDVPVATRRPDVPERAQSAPLPVAARHDPLPVAAQRDAPRAAEGDVAPPVAPADGAARTSRG